MAPYVNCIVVLGRPGKSFNVWYLLFQKLLILEKLSFLHNFLFLHF